MLIENRTQFLLLKYFIMWCSIDTGNCFINDSTIQQCATQACIYYHGEEENENEQVCASQALAKQTTLQMATLVDTSTRELQRSTIWICKYNECNSKFIFSTILTALEKYYSLWQMFHALNMVSNSGPTTIRDLPSLNSTATIRSTSTTTEVEMTPESSMISAMQGTTKAPTNQAPSLHAISLTCAVFIAFIAWSLL